MFFPDQPLHIHHPPTQLLSVDRLIAGLAPSTLLLSVGPSLGFAWSHRSTPRQNLLFTPHSFSPYRVCFIRALNFSSLALALDSNILLYILLSNNVLGIFSHNRRVHRESFRGSRKFPSGDSDCLDLEENSPRRARSNKFLIRNTPNSANSVPLR